MILGVYWSYVFPKGIYKYKYFDFENARGGFDDRPAELKTTVIVPNPDKIIEEITALHSKYSECQLYICQENNKLQIGTSNYELYDYEFLLFKRIDNILIESKSKKTREIVPNKENTIILENKNWKFANDYPIDENIKIHHDSRENYSSSLKFIHINCYILSGYKSDFINDLKNIAIEENLSVFYHIEVINGTISNLLLNFSNGRQGLELKEKIYTDCKSFEEKVTVLFEKYNVSFEYQQGFDSLSQMSNSIQFEMIADNDFIFDRKSAYDKFQKPNF